MLSPWVYSICWDRLRHWPHVMPLPIIDIPWGVSELRLNGHPVPGEAVLEIVSRSNKRIRAAITVPSGSPMHQTARQAVLAKDFEVTLEGEAHEPLEDAVYTFTARGQLVNGRVGRDIKADFSFTAFVAPPRKAR